MNAFVDRGDAREDRIGELHGRDLATAQFFAGIGKRECGEAHSMIFGTLKKVSSRSGALASRASALGCWVTLSSRSAWTPSTVWLNGSTSVVSSSASLSM